MRRKAVDQAKTGDGPDTPSLTRELGIQLRRARLRRGLTLRQVEVASRGLYKPSSIASYERGERRITVERLCSLASFLGADPGRMISEALGMTMLRAREEVLLDLRDLSVVLPNLDASERQLLEERVLRPSHRETRDLGAVAVLSASDIERLAADLGRTPLELLSMLRDAVRGDPLSGRSASGG